VQGKTEARKAVGRDEATDATEEYLNELEAEMLAAAETSSSSARRACATGSSP